MSSWDDTTVGGGMSLLPAGIRTYNITAARVDVNQRGAGPALRELTIALASTDGHGEATVPLEPFDRSPDGVAMWERIFKSAAVGLGFQPSGGHLPMMDVADEFARWVPGSGLTSCAVECEVTHHDSKRLKDDGTPFVNHRVKFRGIVDGSTAAAPEQPVPSFASAGAGAEDPWA